MMNELLGFFVLGGPLSVLLLFLLVAMVVVLVAIREGHRRGRPWGRWTVIAIMVFLFWDLPLVRGVFHYQCATESGFNVYKPLEEWKAENPGVAERLQPAVRPEWTRQGNLTRVPLNQRFEWVIERRDLWFDVRRREERIEDVRTGEVLARYVDFSAGRPWKTENLEHLRAYKFWLDVRSCESDGSKSNRSAFYDFKFETKNIRR